MEVPLEHEARELDRIIFDELTLGRVERASRERYFDILQAMGRRGAEAVIIACTELPLLTEGVFTPPLACYNSTRLHAERAVELSLESA
jgi:aspartate racemase